MGRGKARRKSYFFCVRDNGIGLQKEKLYQIQSGLLQNSDENHIGLKNVDHRLKLIYGQSHGLKIESVNGQGTSVSFRIPEVEMEIEAK